MGMSTITEGKENAKAFEQRCLQKGDHTNFVFPVMNYDMEKKHEEEMRVYLERLQQQKKGFGFGVKKEEIKEEVVVDVKNEANMEEVVANVKAESGSGPSPPGTAAKNKKGKRTSVASTAVPQSAAQSQQVDDNDDRMEVDGEDQVQGVKKEKEEIVNGTADEMSTAIALPQGKNIVLPDGSVVRDIPFDVKNMTKLQRHRWCYNDLGNGNAMIRVYDQKREIHIELAGAKMDVQHLLESAANGSKAGWFNRIVQFNLNEHDKTGDLTRVHNAHTARSILLKSDKNAYERHIAPLPRNKREHGIKPSDCADVFEQHAYLYEEYRKRKVCKEIVAATRSAASAMRDLSEEATAIREELEGK